MEERKIYFLAYVTPRGPPWVSLKNSSQLDPAVWPAIDNICIYIYIFIYEYIYKYINEWRAVFYRFMGNLVDKYTWMDKKIDRWIAR